MRIDPYLMFNGQCEAAFKFYEMGYASTLAYGLFALLFVFTLIQLRMYRRADA